MQRKSFLSGLVTNTKQNDLTLLKKVSNKVPTQKTMRGNNVMNIIEEIKIKVNKYLGDYKDSVKSCRDENELKEYIDKAINNGILSLDTETTGLDCLQDLIVGTCLYTPGEKAIYIPHKHKSYITGQYLQNQISYEFMREQLQRAVDSGVKFFMHNGKFDMRMMISNFGVRCPCYWDTMIAAKLINNLEEASLKYQYNYHLKNQEKTYDFSKLFKGVDYASIPVETAVLYAATDALITYELYKYQKPILTQMPKTYKLFTEVEMPLIDVIIDMENTGVCIDIPYASKLHDIYSVKVKQAFDEVYTELNKYNAQILAYKSRFPANKLSNPININSSSQLAVLLYDILQVGIVDKQKPRSTDKEALELMNLPLCKLILEAKELDKLLGTFIDKLPTTVNPNDKKIHASFNQIGADTGRFSSSNPNLQQIPSHDTLIRQMFVASPGYYLLGSDYSQQEPKLLTFYSQDINMANSYEQGKDLYAQIASMSFDKSYNDCLEFYPEGTTINENGKVITCGYKTHTNKEGKARRSAAKSILLGIMYGRGAKSIGEQIGKTTKEAQEIINKFYSAFPTVKNWTDKTVADAKINGYVETWYGRRRYIKNIQLPEYAFEYIDNRPKNFNPLDFDTDEELSKTVDTETIDYYTNLLHNARGFHDKESIKQKAFAEGVKIHDNGGYLATATRQCVNSRIQGGAADMTKRAMIMIYNNQELKKLGFRLLIGVHDELIGECPKENAKRCAELLSYCMVNGSADIINIKQKCDVEISEKWYGESISL